ncbi:MAG: hypothetical protein Q4G69_02420 [Planctomycetia bacterium]|nr:hypothetical protein [Planctomycetia bacterium]
MNRLLKSFTKPLNRLLIWSCGIFLAFMSIFFLFFLMRTSAFFRVESFTDPRYWGLFAFCLFFYILFLATWSVILYLRERPCLPDELATGRIWQLSALWSAFPLLFAFHAEASWKANFVLLIVSAFVYILCAKIIAVFLFRIMDHLFFEQDLPDSTIKEEIPNEEEEDLYLSPNILHQQTRVLQEDGTERIEGCFRIFFDPSEDQKIFHISFCPPYPSIPFFHAEEISRENIKIKISRILPFGVRLELKRDQNSAKKRLETLYTYLVLEDHEQTH